ncbi:MAG: hypothetical protein AABY99_01880 [Pseudomonadota bacterium]
MTNTETCMREMRHIVALFSKSNGFDEQWILFKAYLNTAHSLSDNDSVAKENFHQNELMNFALVLRNILHHQPAKWHFGKHDVQPTSMSFSFSQNTKATFSAELSLVIQKNTLEEQELQQILGGNSKKQLATLCASLEKINSHVIIVLSLMQEVQKYVEQYCKSKGQYTERFDNEPNGYTLIQNA